MRAKCTEINPSLCEYSLQGAPVAVPTLLPHSEHLECLVFRFQRVHPGTDDVIVAEAKVEHQSAPIGRLSGHKYGHFL